MKIPMLTKRTKIFILLFLTFCWMLPRALAQEIDSLYINEINMIKGELETIQVHGLTRLSLTDPSVADIVSADDKKILLVARNPGQTSLFLWDQHGKRQLVIQVYSQNLDLIGARLQQLFQLADIDEVRIAINEQEGKIVLSGNLPQDKKANFDQIVLPFEGQIISLVAVAKVEEMVQVDMQITELKETLARTLGIEWLPSAITYKEALPAFNGVSDLFKIGDFARETAINAKINALLEEGKARILSQPRLVVISGQEASFLVGGEVPIRTTSLSEGGVTTESISFRPYGINMTITPTIIDNKVDIVLNVSVSEVDTATAGLVKESVAFSTRTATTRLNLDDGQLIILAGLIKRNNSETVKKVPFLGDVPILGLLFRNKAKPAELDQELVISLRPHILTREETVRESKINKISQATSAPEEQVMESAVTDEHKEEPVENAPQPFVIEETMDSADVSARIASPIPGEMLEYVQLIQQKISQAIEYPKEALEHGWEGTVKIGLLILKDGSLALASIKESSGYEIFDENALSTAKNVSPYSSFPSGTNLEELNITIPIIYSLTNNN